MGSWVDTAVQRAKRMMAPLLASFLCFLFVVVRPLADLGGEYAFLCYTAVLIFFFPSRTTGGQLEATFLGISFAAFGMAWTNVALAITARCAQFYGPDSVQGRAVLGVGLALMSLVGGWTRSYQPRLTMATRIALFFPIFHLTSRQGITTLSYHDFTSPFLVATFAGAFALLSHLLLSFHGAGPNLGQLLAGTLSTLQQILPLALESMTDSHTRPRSATASPRASSSGDESSNSIDLESISKSTSPVSIQMSKLSKVLRGQISRMHSAHMAYTNEIVRSRLPASSLEPIIAALKSIARNPLLGLTGHTPGERIKAAMERSFGISSTRVPNSISPVSHRGAYDARSRSRGRQQPRQETSIPPWIRQEQSASAHSSSTSVSSLAEPRLTESCRELQEAICLAWADTQERLCHLYAWTAMPLEEAKGAGDTQMLEERLRSRLAALEYELGTIFCSLEGEAQPIRGRALDTAPLDRDDYRLAFYMISLLDLGRETLRLSSLITEQQSRATGMSKWRWPLMFWPLSLLRRRESAKAKPNESETNQKLESQEDGLEEDLRHLDFIHASLRRPHSMHGVEGRAQRVQMLWRRIWDDPRVLKVRIFLSQLHHQTRHSTHVLFAVKLSGGISLLALPAFLPPDTAGRMWFHEWRFAWAVVSYMYVLETHTGAILRVGFFRLTGTFVGAVAAYVCALIAHDNPYALVALAMVCAVPITYIILFTSFPGLGTVAGITLPPLLFIEYLDLAEGASTFHLAWTRFIDIAIGIIAAVIVGSLVWPDHARVRYFSVISTTLERMNEYYLHMSRDNLRSSLIYANDPETYRALESALRRDISRARTLIAVQKDEVSLLPRPTKLYSEVVDASERLIDTMAEIRLLRFSVPRKETVLDVLPIRRELVSAILINLWAISQAFRSRAPLPQFLPAPREPLEEVMSAIEKHGRDTRRRSRVRSTDTPVGEKPRHGKTLSVDAVPRFEVSELDSAPPSRTPSPGPTSTGSGERGEELAFLYAMAENEALGELCGVLDELVAAARTLFGSQTFLDTSVRQPRSTVHTPTPGTA